MSESVGLLHVFSLAIDADYGFGIRLAKVYPGISEINFYAIDIGDLFICILLFDSSEDGIDINIGSELNFIFGDGILREVSLDLRDLFSRLSH